MQWQVPIPLIAAVASCGVCLSRRRPILGVLGLLAFGAGYVMVIIDEDRGANSIWHLVWLVGLALLALGMVPRAKVGCGGTGSSATSD